MYGTHDPVRRRSDTRGNLLERALSVGKLGDPVEQRGHLDKVAVALDQPWRLREAGLLHLAIKLNVRGERRALGHGDTRRPRLAGAGGGSQGCCFIAVGDRLSLYHKLLN
jgi:hypothetical protein